MEKRHQIPQCKMADDGNNFTANARMKLPGSQRIRITESKYSAVACRPVSVKEYISLSTVAVYLLLIAVIEAVSE